MCLPKSPEPKRASSKYSKGTPLPEGVKTSRSEKVPRSTKKNNNKTTSLNSPTSQPKHSDASVSQPIQESSNSKPSDNPSLSESMIQDETNCNITSEVLSSEVVSSLSSNTSTSTLSLDNIHSSVLLPDSSSNTIDSEMVTPNEMNDGISESKSPDKSILCTLTSPEGKALSCGNLISTVNIALPVQEDLSKVSHILPPSEEVDIARTGDTVTKTQESPTIDLKVGCELETSLMLSSEISPIESNVILPDSDPISGTVPDTSKPNSSKPSAKLLSPEIHQEVAPAAFVSSESANTSVSSVDDNKVIDKSKPSKPELLETETPSVFVRSKKLRNRTSCVPNITPANHFIPSKSEPSTEPEGKYNASKSISSSLQSLAEVTNNSLDDFSVRKPRRRTSAGGEMHHNADINLPDNARKLRKRTSEDNQNKLSAYNGKRRMANICAVCFIKFGLRADLDAEIAFGHMLNTWICCDKCSKVWVHYRCAPGVSPRTRIKPENFPFTCEYCNSNVIK